MEVGDVFADEVMDFGIVASPPVVDGFAVLLAPLLGRGDVADRRIEPDVPVIARTVGNLEAKVGRRPRDVPIAERLVQEMALEVVGDFRLQWRRSSIVQQSRNRRSVEHEKVLGRADFGCGPGERTPRIDQIGWHRKCVSQFSQLSPYCSGDLHLGQVPLTKRSARNVPATGS